MTIKALVGCQNNHCACEVSYTLDMVRMFDGEPVCQGCYEDGDYGKRDENGELLIEWTDLPKVTLADLSE